MMHEHVRKTGHVQARIRLEIYPYKSFGATCSDRLDDLGKDMNG